LEAVLDRSPSARLRVASLEELFKSKVIVSAKRSKSRDWLDLHILMTQRGFGAKDYFAAFREAGIPSQAEISLARLCSGVPQKDDEGYDHLMPNPPTLGDLKQFFQGLRETEETKAAAAAFGKKLGF
jgi:hypothetical protein